MTKSNEEIWKPIKDYENLDGKRNFRTSGNWDSTTRTYDWEATDLVESKGE